jgi:hypothetical protein
LGTDGEQQEDAEEPVLKTGLGVVGFIERKTNVK